MSQPFSLVFHDSEVHAVHAADGAACVRFSAAHVRRGADTARGYLGGVEIAATGAAWRGEVAPGIGRVVAGRLRRDGVDLPPAIPSRLAGALSLELRFANGTQLSIDAATIEIRVDDGARFKEDFSC